MCFGWCLINSDSHPRHILSCSRNLVCTITKIVYETFHVPAMFVACPGSPRDPEHTLDAVLDFVDGESHTAPTNEGRALPLAWRCSCRELPRIEKRMTTHIAVASMLRTLTTVNTLVPCPREGQQSCVHAPTFTIEDRRFCVQHLCIC